MNSAFKCPLVYRKAHISSSGVCSHKEVEAEPDPYLVYANICLHCAMLPQFLTQIKIDKNSQLTRLQSFRLLLRLASCS